jgi:hypothetical protein
MSASPKTHFSDTLDPTQDFQEFYDIFSQIITFSFLRIFTIGGIELCFNTIDMLWESKDENGKFYIYQDGLWYFLDENYMMIAFVGEYGQHFSETPFIDLSRIIYPKGTEAIFNGQVVYYDNMLWISMECPDDSWYYWNEQWEMVDQLKYNYRILLLNEFPYWEFIELNESGNDLLEHKFGNDLLEDQYGEHIPEVTKICQFFNKGICKFGTKCQNLHPDAYKPLQDAVSEQALRDAVSEQALRNTATEQALRNTATEQALRNTATEQALRNAATEQALRDAAEQALRNAATERALRDAATEQALRDDAEKVLQDAAYKVLKDAAEKARKQEKDWYIILLCVMAILVSLLDHRIQFIIYFSRPENFSFFTKIFLSLLFSLYVIMVVISGRFRPVMNIMVMYVVLLLLCLVLVTAHILPEYFTNG